MVKYVGENGEKYIDANTLNSVTSVPSFCHGPSAPKSLAMTFSNVLPTSPL